MLHYVSLGLRLTFNEWLVYSSLWNSDLCNSASTLKSPNFWFQWWMKCCMILCGKVQSVLLGARCMRFVSELKNVLPQMAHKNYKFCFIWPNDVYIIQPSRILRNSIRKYEIRIVIRKSFVICKKCYSLLSSFRIRHNGNKRRHYIPNDPIVILQREKKPNDILWYPHTFIFRILSTQLPDTYRMSGQRMFYSIVCFGPTKCLCKNIFPMNLYGGQKIFSFQISCLMPLKSKRTTYNVAWTGCFSICLYHFPLRIFLPFLFIIHSVRFYIANLF